MSFDINSLKIKNYKWKSFISIPNENLLNNIFSISKKFLISRSIIVNCWHFYNEIQYDCSYSPEDRKNFNNSLITDRHFLLFKILKLPNNAFLKIQRVREYNRRVNLNNDDESDSDSSYIPEIIISWNEINDDIYNESYLDYRIALDKEEDEGMITNTSSFDDTNIYQEVEEKNNENYNNNDNQRLLEVEYFIPLDLLLIKVESRQTFLYYNLLNENHDIEIFSFLRIKKYLLYNPNTIIRLIVDDLDYVETSVEMRFVRFTTLCRTYQIYWTCDQYVFEFLMKFIIKGFRERFIFDEEIIYLNNPYLSTSKDFSIYRNRLFDKFNPLHFLL